MRQKRALITGAAGQDGYYLAQLLAAKGYRLDLVTRRAPAYGLAAADWHRIDLATQGALEALILGTRPDEIYNLAGFSRPLRSWDLPFEALAINADLPLRILEVLRRSLPSCRFFQANSSEIMGNAATALQDESSPIQPENPYAVSKATAHWLVRAYREKHGLFACSGILFNHESPRRSLAYVTQKIAIAAALIGEAAIHRSPRDETGRPLLTDGRVALGNLDVARDFGFAGDYVRAMWLMLQADRADDYVVGTGQSHSIRDVCETAFAHVGLDWREFVVVDPALVRRIDSRRTCADATRARTELGWSPEVSFAALIAMMVDANVERLAEPRIARAG